MNIRFTKREIATLRAAMMSAVLSESDYAAAHCTHLIERKGKLIRVPGSDEHRAIHKRTLRFIARIERLEEKLLRAVNGSPTT